MTTGGDEVARGGAAPGLGRLAVVGIGEDGWTGLGSRPRDVLRAAHLIVGAPRQLARLPAGIVGGEREAWPSPMMPRVQSLAEAVTAHDPSIAGTVVLGSGDPMLHGIGATFARLVDPARLAIFPAPSAYSLACARLGWAQHEVPLVSLVADPQHDPIPALAGGRAIVYVAGRSGARRLAALLRAAGLGAAELIILANLGGKAEHERRVIAAEFDEDLGPLHLVAVDVRAVLDADDSGHGGAPGAAENGAMASGAAALPAGGEAANGLHPATASGEVGADEGRSAAGSTAATLVAEQAGEPAAGVVPSPRRRRLMSRVPGLPDDFYGGDGQLTRADVRAVALAALAPAPGEVLWDVGAGSGTIAIEWCRAASRARAIAIEVREDRCATIAENARSLEAPRVEVIHGSAPGALEGLPRPHAIFLGGATSHPGLVVRCWEALLPGGRIVGSAVTLEGERSLTEAHAQFGGRLVRLQHDHAGSLGSFTAWKPQRAIIQWSITKGTDAN